MAVGLSLSSEVRSVTTTNAFHKLATLSLAMFVCACQSTPTLPPRGSDHPARPDALLVVYEPPADPFAASPTYTLVKDAPRALAGQRPPRGEPTAEHPAGTSGDGGAPGEDG
jgi:hypothetical protein